MPEPPYLAVAKIAPVPLLVVHGDPDPYFPPEHAHQLYASAGEPKQLWLERGFGHADNGASPQLLARIADWISEHC